MKKLGISGIVIVAVTFCLCLVGCGNSSASWERTQGTGFSYEIDPSWEYQIDPSSRTEDGFIYTFTPEGQPKEGKSDKPFFFVEEVGMPENFAEQTKVEQLKSIQSRFEELNYISIVPVDSYEYGCVQASTAFPAVSDEEEDFTSMDMEFYVSPTRYVHMSFVFPDSKTEKYSEMAQRIFSSVEITGL